MDLCGRVVANPILSGIFRIMELRMIRHIVLWILVIGLVISFLPQSLEACPACKDLNEPIARGFNWSVLFMMSMPFTVFGIIGGSVFYLYRRTNRNLKT